MFYALLETRVCGSNAAQIVDGKFRGWEVVQNYAYALNGRIWILSGGDFNIISCPQETSDFNGVSRKLCQSLKNVKKLCGVENSINNVEESWNMPPSRTPLQVLFTKLKRLKEPLKKLNNEAYSDISNRVFVKQVELANLQKDLMVDPTAGNIERERFAARQKANTIIVPHDDQGQKLDIYEGISNELVQFFLYSLDKIDSDVDLAPDVLL
ncbi:hypothetical protein V6N13_085637 [Hibiscus sabdariffa]